MPVKPWRFEKRVRVALRGASVGFTLVILKGVSILYILELFARPESLSTSNLIIRTRVFRPQIIFCLVLSSIVSKVAQDSVMSSTTDTKLDPKEEQVPSTEPNQSQQGNGSAASRDPPHSSTASEEKPKANYTEMAQSAATSATSAASGVKDNLFSMFGGGAKKEKKEEVADDPSEPSGSSKAKRDADAAEADQEGERGEVSVYTWAFY